MHRSLERSVRTYWDKKIILLSGPRQVGKTTLAKSLSTDFAYYNYDIKKDLKIFKDQDWDRSKSLVIFDEIHKMKKWKLWLKGIFDEGALQKQKIVVTGSARLDISRRVGDSLAGRHFSYRLHPLDLKELKQNTQNFTLDSNYKRLLEVGGFPEPFLDGSAQFYRLWNRSHADAILKQDLIPLGAIRDLEGIELLMELLAQRVGSVISFNSLAEDLDRDGKTIKHWVEVLENLYVVFRISPYSKNIARGLKKASKFYFYDLARVEGNESQKLENLTALSLRKEIDFLEDTQGVSSELYFIQTTDKKEIDFVVLRKQKNPLLIEVKLNDASPSKNFELLKKAFPRADKLQLVNNLDRAWTSKTGVRVDHALKFLSELDLS